uniref:Cellular retinoic acid-binding protein 1 n=1 Tax=Neolamprologus brichardi TaxID=32507 RepID=A0A3Q4HXL3_NEOBR
MQNFTGTWKMKSSENFDELLKALGVNAMLRKVAVAAASKPHVEIRQNGEHFYIKTSTTVRTTEINFCIGEEFNEETVDGRKCKSLATWETENKIYSKQTLLSGNGPKTFWSRELKGDELILVTPALHTHVISSRASGLGYSCRGLFSQEINEFEAITLHFGFAP